MFKKRIYLLFFPVFFVLFFSLSETAAKEIDIEFDSTLGQEEFSSFAEQLGTVIAYKPLSPAEPQGITGFDIGVEVSSIDIDESESFWSKSVADQDPPSSVVLPKIHIQKGLPFGFDVGVVYSKVPQSNISYIGGELKYAILKGTIATPALALRGHYTTLMGIDDLSLKTYGADLSISKGISILTPYIGIGRTYIKATENSPLVNLDSETVSMTHAFAGVKLSLVLINFVAEADIAEIPTYSFLANIGFSLF